MYKYEKCWNIIYNIILKNERLKTLTPENCFREYEKKNKMQIEEKYSKRLKPIALASVRDSETLRIAKVKVW